MKRDNKVNNPIFILLSVVFFLFLINFISAKVAYNIDQGISVDSSVTTYINGSDINLTTTTCSGTDKISAINNATGVVTCSSDAGSINTTEQLQDAIGTGFTGNLTYDDAGNTYDLNSTNILAWLDSIYTKMSSVWATLGNGTMVAYTTLNNGSYFNSASSGDISSINTTLDAYIYNGSDSGDVYLRFNETRLNLSTYALLSVLNNGTYFNTDTFAPNYTTFLNKVNWADVNNGTITGNANAVLWGDVNNGTIFDINKVEWGDVGNGTLATTNSIWREK